MGAVLAVGGFVVAGGRLGGLLRRAVVGVERRNVVGVLAAVVVSGTVLVVVEGSVVVVEELVVVGSATARRGRPVVAPLGQPAMVTPTAAQAAKRRMRPPRRAAKPRKSMTRA